MKQCLILVGFLLAQSMPVMAETHTLVYPDNMAVLKCKMPDMEYRFLGSRQPGHLFSPGEAVTVTLALKKGPGSFALEIQEITTREPGRTSKDRSAWTDTAGDAPIINVDGNPIIHPLKVTFDDKPEAFVEVPNLPIPERFGTYALVLVHGEERRFLGTVARVVPPCEGGTIDNTPVFGDGQFFDRPELYGSRAKVYARMGVRGWRTEAGCTRRPDGTDEFGNLDTLFSAAEASGGKIMITLAAQPNWMQPFGEPTPAANWTPETGGYSGTGDWLCDPKHYPLYGNWITTFCLRYWKDGKGALWGLENFNEPWDGGGISGWARDCLQYREIQKLIATSAKKVSPDILVLAASSIINTEDKFYSDGSNEMDAYVDIFTDHYVPPANAYGPQVAHKHGKQSMETETWFVNSEYLLPQAVAQFSACGQLRTAPWHPRVLFDSLPGTEDQYFIPSPLVAATAAVNHFTAGKAFEKLVFHDHLPWVFQFGKDDDKDALLVVFGQLLSIADNDPRSRLWRQVDAESGGTMTINNADGLLQFYDLAGNPAYVGEKSVRLPMSIFPSYITSTQGAKAAAERLKLAKIEGKRPVEILPKDFTTPMVDGAKMEVVVHNCLNRKIEGNISIKTPAGFVMNEPQQNLVLEAGERKSVWFACKTTTVSAANAYPFEFTFKSRAGNASYQESMNCAVVGHKTITVDGNLEDWKDIPGVYVIAGVEKADAAEQIRRPWLELKDKQPDGSYAEFKLAWDEKYLYVSAQVNDPTDSKPLPRIEGRDENAFFHSASSDAMPAYKKFLEKHPGRSFAEVPYVYRQQSWDGAAFGSGRDRLQFSLDVTDGWQDLVADTDKVPSGFHAVPDADYEYALYLCDDGKPELWRLMAPGVPRIHDIPRQPRGKKTTGPVAGATCAVKREGHVYLYELAIPRDELTTMELKAGTSVGVMVQAGNNAGPSINYGLDKAVTKNNSLSLHPYFMSKSNCGIRWTLAE